MVNAPTIEVANISMADSLILMVMALVVFGPRKLPHLARQLGKLMYEFRKASNDFKFQMEEELRNSEEAERRQKEEAERQRRLAANPPAQIEASTSTPAEAPVATDTPYPYAGTYGEIAEAQEKSAATEPTIRPPSTGEPVPAARPGTEAGTENAQESSPAETPGDMNLPTLVEEKVSVERVIDTKDSAAEETEKTIEPAAHNG